MNKDLVKNLQKTKQILLKNKWIKNAYSKKANGHTDCDILDKSAKCFCLAGAVRKATNTLDISDTERFLDCYVLDKLHLGAIESFNDHPNTTKKDVLKLLDNAIKYAKEST